MTSICSWGIFREREHSPGRETDDTQILQLTAKHLEARGFQVFLKTPEDVSVAIDPRPSCVFLMCERTGVLDVLRAWEAAGIRQVNRPDAVLSTYRERMIARFARARVPFVASRLVSTRAPGPLAATPVWVKRPDVHNTQAGDVVLAGTPAELDDALEALAARGLDRAVLQPHVDGDLIKFYGIGVDVRGAAAGEPSSRSRVVRGAAAGEPSSRSRVVRGAAAGEPSSRSRVVRGAIRARGRPGPPADPIAGPRWFRWFYHRDQRVAGHPFDPRDLERLVLAAAAALGLEIYGGDAIATPSGLVLLDVNAWPSFALYRDEAAVEIAAYLAGRFAGSGA